MQQIDQNNMNCVAVFISTVGSDSDILQGYDMS